MESNCSKFMDNTEAGRAVCILESRAAIQRDLLKFNKSKSEILFLHLLPKQQYRPDANWMKSSFAEKDPGLLVDKSVTSQQCAPATNKANLILGCARKSANVRESDSFRLLTVCETISGALCTVLGSAVQETTISQNTATNLIMRLYHMTHGEAERNVFVKP